MKNKKEAAVSSGRIQKRIQPFRDISFFRADKAFALELLHAFRTRTEKKTEIIPFPELSKVLSWWKIRKDERFDILFALQKAGFLKIVAGHGVILEKQNSKSEEMLSRLVGSNSCPKVQFLRGGEKVCQTQNCAACGECARME